MPQDIRTSKRDLIARVATLELIVADLIHLLWTVDPKAMEKLAADAAHDVDLQHSRTTLSSAEHQRERLYTVLETRRRMLGKKAYIAA